MNLWPRPLQQPHPPIYIPGAGSTETMKFCAERKYTYMSVYAPTRIVRRWFDGYRQAAADLGYVPDPERIAFSVPIYVADTDEQAHAEARPVVEWLYHKGLKQTPADGDTSRLHVTGVAARRAVVRAARARRVELRGPARLGTGGRRVARLGRRAAGTLYAELGGFGQLIGLFAIGPSTHEQVMRSTELFATEVMPVLRPLGAKADVSAGGQCMSALRDELITGIRASRERFESAGDRAEELRTLPHDAVATLRSLGLFWLKTPAELGGTPLPPVEFCDVIEELAYVDTSTAWAAMIGAGCNGLAGGWLPEAGARRIFGGARRRRARGWRRWRGAAGGRRPARPARHRASQ